ncbi:MAG: hypothetical protein IJ112_01180 [Oscillospiraceae bacterium]|nr:hypothetical protein [Oscillospiraceae bacterium]
MTKLYRLRWIFLSFALTVICGFVILALVTSGASMDFRGFALDRSGRVYVGKTEQIEVVQGGETVDSIPAGRGYAFTIRDGRLFVASGGQVYVKDLGGNTISQYGDPAMQEYDQLQSTKNSFTASDGTVYVRRDKLVTPYQIVRASDGETVYTMPAKDYALRIAVVLWPALFLICMWNAFRLWALKQQK